MVLSGMLRSLNVIFCVGGVIKGVYLGYVFDRSWRIREGSRIEDEFMYFNKFRWLFSMRKISM